MGYPPPDRITNEIDDEQCWWHEGTEPDTPDCERAAVTTRYESWSMSWWPVCDKHRR